MNILVQRNSTTQDGIFGCLTIDTNPFMCVTVENKADAIPAGEYSMEFTFSPAFNMIMPLIDVPGRTAIRFHIANYPYQLKGCIALGNALDCDSVDESRVAFNQFNVIVNPTHQAGTSHWRVLVKDIPPAT